MCHLSVVCRSKERTQWLQKMMPQMEEEEKEVILTTKSRWCGIGFTITCLPIVAVIPYLFLDLSQRLLAGWETVGCEGGGRDEYHFFEDEEDEDRVVIIIPPEQGTAVLFVERSASSHCDLERQCQASWCWGEVGSSTLDTDISCYFCATS